jgi:TonB family protein
MAQYPMFGPDPAKPALSAGYGRVENGAGSPTASAAGESELAELAAKFAAHGGGRVSPELGVELALEVVLNEIVEQACLATGASGAALVLERGGEWGCRARAGDSAPELGARLEAEAGLSGACVKTRKVQRCDDAQADPRADMEACRILGVRSVIILPLLRNEELAGVFELFSSRPSAFRERDERTLEALAQRALKNLERASEALSARVEPARAAWPVGKKMIAEGVVTENIVAENVVTKDVVTKSVVTKNMDATSDADYGALDRPVPQPVSEAASGRAIHLITWVLGATLLAVAVLLTVRVGQRLGVGRATARAHPPAAISAPLSGAGDQSAAASGGATEGAASPTSASQTPGNQSAASRSSDTPRSGAGSVASTSGGAHSTDSSPPAGSLRVYENGKEVFRMPPTVELGGATNATSTHGTDASSAEGTHVQRASAVEPSGALEVSPEVAEGSLLHRVEPDYPEEARRQQIQGPVVLDVRTGRDGAVQEVKLVSGQRLLAEAAMAAVKQWRFGPRMAKGQPVEMQTKVTLNFRLPTQDRQ